MGFIAATGPALSVNVPGSFFSDSWPQLALLADGSAVSTHRSFAQGNFQVALTTLNRDATRVTDRSDADEGSRGQRNDTDVAALEGGGFAVTWPELTQTGPVIFEIRARAFDAEGRPAGPALDAFDDIDFNGSVFGIAPVEGGGFAVLGAGSGAGHLRLFDASGTPRTDSLSVPALTSRADADLYPFAGGLLAAVDFGTRSYDLFDRRGRLVETDLIAEIGGVPAGRPAMIPLDDERTLLAGVVGNQLRAQILGPDGAPIGGAIEVSEAGDADDSSPELTNLSDGSVLVSWIVRPDGDAPWIEARILDTDGTPLSPVERVALLDEANLQVVTNTGLTKGGAAIGWAANPPGTPNNEAFVQGFVTELSRGVKTGSDGRDRIDGGRKDDVIVGLGGRDRLNGEKGDDALHGKDGADRASGGAGDDWIDGGEGNDRLEGDAGADTLIGGTGNDKLTGGKGDDYMMGQEGDDLLSGLAGADVLYAGAGADTLRGGGGDDTLHNGPGETTVIGGGGADTIILRDHDATTTVQDFDLARDRVNIEDWFFGTAFAPEDALNAFGRIEDGDTLLELNFDTLRLVGITDWDALAERLETGGGGFF